MRRLGLIALLTPVLYAQSESAARAAVTRSMPLLERSAAAFIAKRACVSCHHNILPILAFHIAQERGIEVDSRILAAIEDKTLRQLRGAMALDEAVEASTLSDPTPNDSMLLMAADRAGMPRGLVTGVYAYRLLRWQREGHWVTSDFRPPHSSSMFTASATAVRAIRLYLPEELSAEGDAALGRARQWFLKTRPQSTEDAAFRLLGLVWAGAAPTELAVAQKDLLDFQQPAGGWAELPDYPADAYSTGEALFALHQSGLAVRQAALQKGLRFLLSTQAKDGSWRVKTRMLSPAEVSPRYFSTGFPYGKDEYLSYAASCWAVMALLSTLPERAAQPHDQRAPDPPQWERIVLFGNAAQLAGLLDAGLDANTRTANGTTLLMMAAPDAQKVRLLLSRGADPKAAAPSGSDALTIAAAYRGTGDAIEALLHAGAEFRNSALVFASLTGDLRNVKLLLNAGSASAKALTSALTFGYVDVARTLLAAGASARITETTGINLLHWAAITDRPEVIPLLVEAGVALNATDENGFTPLMYAATIDFGDTEALQALLRAGADKSIRNADGRTPREQAHYYGHARLESALR
jgi:ankyrin repeat protein